MRHTAQAQESDWWAQDHGDGPSAPGLSFSWRARPGCACWGWPRDYGWGLWSSAALHCPEDSGGSGLMQRTRGLEFRTWGEVCLSEAWQLPVLVPGLIAVHTTSSFFPFTLLVPRPSVSWPTSLRDSFCKTRSSYCGTLFFFVLQLMKAFYNETYFERNNNYINEFSLTLLWSVSVSMFPFGGFIGSLMVGPLVNKLGRKGTLLFNNIFSIVPAILMGCSEVARSFEMIILSRLLVGICAGLSSNVVPMYLGELAPKNLRGALGVVPQVFITVGILVAQIFGLRNLLANKEGWPILLGLTGIPAALQLLFLPFFPESPRYLLIQKKDEEAARNALKRLRGWDNVDWEMEEIQQEDEAEKAAGFISVLKLFSMRSLRWQVISIIILMGGQQLSGVNAAFVVELLGRRFLLLLGFSVCFTACCVLTVALALQDTISWMPYVSIACVICYVVGHALGPSPIPALLITEIFLQSSRPSAFMVGGSVHWLSNFTVGLIFPFIQVGLGAYSFIIFAVICLLTTIYIFLVVPETKAKTFMEINQIFTKMNKVSEVHPEKEELKDFPLSTLGQ
uniref:Solute carrier family 2, facilitated glucose transporter member 5 n=1 Tax=Canis lupus familiaris TaxID=9615 RepID=A0A8C0SJH1_CANLF